MLKQKGGGEEHVFMFSLIFQQEELKLLFLIYICPYIIIQELKQEEIIYVFTGSQSAKFLVHRNTQTIGEQSNWIYN